MENNKTETLNQEENNLDPIDVWARAKRIISGFNSKKTVNQYFSGIFRVTPQQVSQAFQIPCRQPGLLKKIHNHISLLEARKQPQSTEAA